MAFTKTQVSELYVTLMGRASETKGNQWWQDNFDDQTKAAEAMLGSDAVKTYFGNTITEDADFIANIYKNTLNKSADGADDTIKDPNGIEYWTARLTGDTKGPQLTRAEMIVEFIKVANASTTPSGTQFSNRVSVSDYAAENLTDAPEGYKELLSFHNNGDKGLVVTDTATGVDIADGIIDGLSGGAISLTENPDTVSGNIINANRVWNPGGTDQLNSLNDDDNLTGTGDNPTLNVTFVNDTESGDNNIMPELTDIETVNIDFTADFNQTIDLQDSTGIKNLNATRIDNNVNVTFDNIQETLTSATVASSNDNLNSNVIFDHRTAAVSGDADELALKIDDVQMNILRIDDGANDGYETINLESTGKANVINAIIAEDIQTLNITGDQDLTISSLNESGSFNLVDASTLAANLDFTLDQGVLDAIPDGLSNGDIAFTLKSAAGDDTVRISDTVGKTDTIELAEGNDTLVVQAVNPTDNYTEAGTTITGVEKVELLNSDADNAVIGILADEVDGDQTFILRNNTDGAGNNTTYNIANLSEEEAKNISIEHSGDKATNPAASSNALADNVVNLDVAEGTSVSISIDEGVNADPRFNFELYTDSDTSIDAITGALKTGAINGEDNGINTVTSLTINDNDTESNTVELKAQAQDKDGNNLGQATAYTDTITVTGGLAGTFMNLDATANLDKKDISGSATDAVGISDVGMGAAERIIAANFDAKEANSDVTARFSDNPNDNNFGGQTIEMGSGNDTVIFDKLNDSTAGLTISDTVSGGEGWDVLAIDGHNAPKLPTNDIAAISLGESEWTNVSGMDEILLVGNGSQATDNNGDGTVDMADQRVSTDSSPIADKAGYNLTLTNGLVGSTDNGSNIKITNDSKNADNSESSATIDATGLDRTHHFSYDGEEGAGATADVFKFSDASMNGSNVIDGGDEDTTNVASQNSDVIEIWNTAIVTAGDLENISNVGGISFRSDSTVSETLTLTLTDEILDAFDSSHTATSDEAETISLISVDETVAGNVGMKNINIDVSDVTLGKFKIDISNLDTAHTNLIYSGVSANDFDKLFINDGQAVSEYMGTEQVDANAIALTADTVAVDGVAETFTYPINSTTNDVISRLDTDITLTGFTVGEDTLTFLDVATGDVTTAGLLNEITVSTSAINDVTNIIFDENANGDAFELVLTGIQDADLSTLNMTVA